MENNTDKERVHEPVLIKEVLDYFDFEAPLKKQACYIDATLGNAGHAIEIIKRGGKVLGIEADREMLEIAEDRLEKACPALENKSRAYKVIQANFREIEKIASQAGFSQVDGILFDLGTTSTQLMSPKRGFSFTKKKAPLDMRIDPENQVTTAADLLNALRGDQLKELFSKVTDKGKAKRLSKLIVERRKENTFQTVGDLLDLTEKVFTGEARTHPATKAFLALRMAVNSELENLAQTLPGAFELLKPGGRLIVISFHSGEDLIVKTFFRKQEGREKGLIITKKPITPSLKEMRKNPRARSAKLRVLEKRKVS